MIAEPSGSIVSVLLADDDPAMVAALVELVDREPGLAVVATAADADEAIRLATRHRPDVALIDVKMPGSGVRAAREIRRLAPDTRVVAFSAHEERTSIASMLRAGALGYVIKGAPIDEILDAVRRASRGLASLSGRAAIGVAGELEEHLGRQELATEQARALASQVAGALEPGAIQAVYQPIADLGTLRVVGYEALARVSAEPARGPDAWFAAAEEAGMRVELELAAVRAAVAGFNDLPSDAFLALNVSPATAVAEELAVILLSVPADRIMLEITEHAPVLDYDALAGGLAAFRARGGRLAVDDAGAGFASLRHILRLAPDLIKLDISLTQNIDVDRARRSLASALIAFAAEMGITVLAEGVETQAELQALRELGATLGQGYLLGRPGALPAANPRSDGQP